MRGRPVIHDNQELVKKAQNIFWRKGYTATSVNDLLIATGAGSGSFYNTFKGGKKEIFSKSIQERRKAFILFKYSLSRSEYPIDLIKDFFKSIVNDDNSTHLKGCIIANTIVEMSFVDVELHSESIAILKEVGQMFTEAIRNSQEKGEMRNQTDSEILGKYLVTFWCGLNTLRRMYPDKKILSQQIEMQLAVIS